MLAVPLYYNCQTQSPTHIMFPTVASTSPLDNTKTAPFTFAPSLSPRSWKATFLFFVFTLTVTFHVFFLFTYIVTVIHHALLFCRSNFANFLNLLPDNFYNCLVVRPLFHISHFRYVLLVLHTSFFRLLSWLYSPFKYPCMFSKPYSPGFYKCPFLSGRFCSNTLRVNFSHLFFHIPRIVCGMRIFSAVSVITGMRWIFSFLKKAFVVASFQVLSVGNVMLDRSKAINIAFP